jgi:hypothetical protein
VPESLGTLFVSVLVSTLILAQHHRTLVRQFRRH